MNFQKVFLLTILLGLIVPVASAADPGQIILSSDTDWLVANGADSARITVQVLDGSGAPLPNCTVTLSADPVYGRLAPATVTTNASGTAIATFAVNRTSGDAVITARAGAAEGTFEQKIDHDLPSRITHLHYDSEVTAGNTTTIVAGVADRHGNPVDDRRVTETVRFSVGSVEGDAVFFNDVGASVPILEPSVNATGFVRAELRTDRIIGENIVRMTVLPGSVDRYISIHGLPTGLPTGIAITVDPDADPVPYQPADGESTFTLTYRLSDTWGNPAAGRDIRVNTSLGESVVLPTNSTGVACLLYGPKDATGVVNITATAVDNASVTIAQEVEFIHTAPVDMLLSASPQSMPSRDVDAGSVSHLRAKVMDIKGNPVPGEDVTFTIDTGSIRFGSYTQTGAPYLLPEGRNEMSATTGDDGYAIVRFHPGKFARPGEEGWDAAAKGTATVRATWEGVTRNLTLTWINYPYLSVETSVSNETVGVNDTTDVTIRLKGDGWELRPDPIDVVLVVDRSGSMGNNDVGQTRMKAAQTAAKTFISQMNPDWDRIGLISFSSSTRVDNNLSDSFEGVTANLDGLKADGATQLRRAIYEAILMQKENQDRPEAVKAVVVMTDGDWNYDGSPLGHGTGYPENASNAYSFSGNKLEPDHYRYYDGLGGTLEWSARRNYWRCKDGESTNQNMSRFADDNGVKLYTITFAYKPGPTVNETMQILASSTGGFYEHASGEKELTDIYKRIAGELKTEAGVGTRMNLNFSTIQVNEGYRNGSDVFSYVYEDGVSTTIESWVENKTPPYVITPKKTLNQTDDWNDDHTLNFDVGTVHLDQVWEATFRLRVLTDGNINVFGPGSTITFNDGAAELDLPDTFITAKPDLNNTGLGSATLALTDPRYTCAEPVLEFLTVAWNQSYTGSGTVTEIVEYSNDGGFSWLGFETLTADSAVTAVDSCLDVRDLPPGEYIIRVRASADDAPESWLLLDPILVGDPQAAYIRLA
ncbi:Ig-like domain-containing protein [Methanoculleus sp.]|uniref:Ig-like domain-containing protein n=1 Tax=Methanoculleus sp. TaxID=90427 RepID=UPI0025E6B829|nr:Ig-like domain-containing protein [Methanoculleus sp.]